MKIHCDPAKRARTLKERGLDFLDAEHVFQGEKFTSEDIRRDYGERRYITIGRLKGRVVVVGWTPRNVGELVVRHVFSMRKANEKEVARFQERLR